MATIPELLTTADVAALLQVHPKHVYRLMKRGLPARRLGGEWRFDRDSVLAWTTHKDGRTEDEPKAVPAEPDPDRRDPAPLLAAAGDLVVEALLSRVNQHGPPLGFVQADAGTGFSLLDHGRVSACGWHGRRAPTHSAAGRLLRLHLAVREVGLCARSDSRLPDLADLPGLRLAGRPATAGIVVHLDAAMKAGGVDPAEVHAIERTYPSHRDVVGAVARGDADVGVTTRAWALAFGLAFRPLAHESYDLLIPAAQLSQPALIRVCEIAQSPGFRTAVDSALYDTSDAGRLTVHTAA